MSQQTNMGPAVTERIPATVEKGGATQRVPDDRGSVSGTEGGRSPAGGTAPTTAKLGIKDESARPAPGIDGSENAAAICEARSLGSRA